MRSIIKYIDEALFSSASEFSKADDIPFVDLGLSIKWAKCNLGAEEETDYGHYYMWGSTKPNESDNCDWEITPFNNGNKEFDKEYFNYVKNKVCPAGILDHKYDVAYQESKGKYRMPTKKEFEELINNTNHEWIKNYEGTKVNGMKFTNKTDDTKFIFIPAAGFCCGTSTFDIGINASVWSVSLNTDYEDIACYLDFYSDDISTNIYGRYGGFSVRCVKDK